MKGKVKERSYRKTDYEQYHFSVKELVKYLGQAAALCMASDYLFYRNLWLLLSEMAEKPNDPGAQEKTELSV